MIESHGIVLKGNREADIVAEQVPPPSGRQVLVKTHVVGLCIFCDVCEFCLRDKNLCKTIEKFGITIDGASRQYFLQDERYVYRADPAAELDLVALSEPLAVGAHAVRRVAELRPNLRQEKILVMGGGTIGLACFFALKYIEQCEHVELHDLVAARVAKAIELGAAEPTDVIAEAGDEEAGAAVEGAPSEAPAEEVPPAPEAPVEAPPVKTPVEK